MRQRGDRGTVGWGAPLWGAALLIASGAGCSEPLEETCTLLGCVDGLTITLDAGDTVPPGTYEIDVLLDGQNEHCTVRIDNFGVTEDCFAVVNLQASPPMFELRFENIRPSSISLSVVRDGAEIVNRSFEAAYQQIQPNGPDCLPTCHQAIHSIVMP